MLVGIRPEACEDARTTRLDPQGRIFAAPIRRIEHLGAEVVVHLTCNEPDSGKVRDLAVRLDSRSVVREGQSLEVVVDTDRLRFFDPDSGAALQ